MEGIIMNDGEMEEEEEDDDDEDATTKEEGRAQELEERMVEESREKIGRSLCKYLPKDDSLASLLPVDMLAEQIVGDVNMEEEEIAAARKRKGFHPVESKNRKKNERVGGATNPISRLLENGSAQKHQRTKETEAQREEEQEAIYFMTIWVEHHVDPVLRASNGDQAKNTCAVESRSSSCSYILPFPSAPELLDCMARMTISTVPPYHANPFSEKPKHGTGFGPTASRT